jgi:DNA ligase (NAD+)
MKPDEIAARLIEAKDAYYNGSPIMSDERFDNLEDELLALDPGNSYFSVVGAETKKAKVRHEIPMLSCDKVKDVAGVLDWIKKIGMEGQEFVVEPKIDGLSCSILYKNGKLVRISTRGDGNIGQDITHISKYCKEIQIPPTVPVKGDIEVRGELYLPKNTKFPNPENKPLRSLATGLINRKDTGLEDLKYIRFVSYQLLGVHEIYEEAKLDMLGAAGFHPIEFGLTSKDHVAEFYNEYLKRNRDAWPYQTDGLVLVVNDSHKWAEIDGKYTVHHHHFYNLALKPPAQSKETTLESIEWNVSRLGKVIPVAIVKTVVLGGTNVSRASLNNAEYVENLSLWIGDRVEIERANDVVPYFKRNITTHRKDEPTNLIPTKCPSCGLKLEREGVHVVCNNPDCPEKNIMEILHWVQKCEMDGISESFVRTLYDEKSRVRTIKDLYLLEEEDFEGIEGFGQKKIKNALEQIEASREMSLRQFVVRLGIPMVGERAMEKIGLITIKELFSYKSDGSVLGDVLEDHIRRNKATIEDLLTVVKVSSEKEKKEGSLRVCMTGKGPRGRKELIDELERMGYTFVDHVGKDTDVLICEDVTGNSSKLTKASRLGVKLVSYGEFFKEVV